MASVLKGKLAAAKSFDSAQPVKLQFELRNDGPEDVYVLKWFTPLEGINSDCLKVLRNQKKVPYDGPLVKRGKPGPKDFVLIPAGKSVTAEADVSASYEVSKPANYKVELKIENLVHVPATVAASASGAARASGAASASAAVAMAKSVPQRQALTKAGIKFKVSKGAAQKPTRGKIARAATKVRAKASAATAAAPSAAGAAGAAAAPLPPICIGGTAARKTKMKKAHKDGYGLCVAALANLANDAQYVQWFGAHTAARLKSVRSSYTKIRDRMKTTVFTYDLSGVGCQSGWFAYTYKGDTTIWMCGGFWAVAATGTDSKAGTVVHEHSHSDARTDDIAYGQVDAGNLAASTPAKAIKNADNYEYYAGG